MRKKPAKLEVIVCSDLSRNQPKINSTSSIDDLVTAQSTKISHGTLIRKSLPGSNKNQIT